MDKYMGKNPDVEKLNIELDSYMAATKTGSSSSSTTETTETKSE
jgi:hypothetical protein